jgi:hypothetical protein
MHWLNGVSGAGVEGLGADVAYIQHAAHALDVDGLAHLTRREHDCAEALQANKQWQRRPRKQTANKHTSGPRRTQAWHGIAPAIAAIANHSFVSVVARTAGRAAWRGMARHGAASHGIAWHGADQAATLAAAKSARIGQRGA